MPLEYVRDDARRRLTVTTIGNLTREEMLSVVDRQAMEDTWGYSVLYLSRDMTSFQTADDMRALVSRVATHSASQGPRGPIAIVDGRITAFGMWRMYETLIDDLSLRLKVFRDAAEAEQWLAQQMP